MLLECLRRRYASTEQLSDDINRYLSDLPITAREDTVFYRASKFIRRHKTASAVAASLLLSLLGGLVATCEARIARLERARAERRFNDVRQLARAIVCELQSRLAALPGTTEVRKELIGTGLTEGTGGSLCSDRRHPGRREPESGGSARGRRQAGESGVNRAAGLRADACARRTELLVHVLDLEGGTLYKIGDGAGGERSIREALRLVREFVTLEPAASFDEAAARSASPERKAPALAGAAAAHRKLGEESAACAAFAQSVKLYRDLLNDPLRKWFGEYAAKAQSDYAKCSPTGAAPKPDTK